MIPRFGDAMALHPMDHGFEGNLNEHWTIGPKIHGGVMLALCAKAAREAYGETGGQERSDAGIGTGGQERSDAGIGTGNFEPVAVSADFLSAPDPGSVQLVTTVRKRGRRIGLVDVELDQGERTCVRAVVTLGEPEHLAEPLLSANPVTPLMAPRTAARSRADRPGTPRRGDQQPGPRLRHPPGARRRATPRPVRRCSRSGCVPRTARSTCCSR